MALDAVIFDWGGTLTAWHDIDFHAESLALAAAVRDAGETDRGPHAASLLDASRTVWGRSRDHQQSATVADLFAEAGLPLSEDLLSAYREFWEPHTRIDPHVVPLLEHLRGEGIAVGVLSNTLWPRDWHEELFRRDGVLDLLDGAVYTSEIPWTKPSERAFAAALEAVGGPDPAACVYVGDRLYDDVWGAQNAGLRAVHIPHSVIPPEQVGHSVGVPDAVAHALSDLPAILARWR